MLFQEWTTPLVADPFRGYPRAACGTIHRLQQRPPCAADSLLPCGLHCGLQENVCSDIWSTSPSFSDLHICRAVSHIFLLIFCHSCFAAFFTLSQIYYHKGTTIVSDGFKLWPEVGPFWSWLCPLWEQPLEASSHRGHFCRPLTTKTLLSKPSTNALNDFCSKPCFVFIELVWELFRICVCMCVCVW